MLSLNIVKERQLTVATHHICNLIFFPSNSIVLILKSIPAKIECRDISY